MKQRVWGILMALLLAAPAMAQKKIECWTDDKGQRMCGDRVPPEYADKERKVMNERGIVVETKRRAKTPEEIAGEERKAKEAEEAKKRAEYDRALLENFRSTKDLEAMRDDRLSLLDSRIASSQKSLADNENSLKGLQERAEALQKEGKPVNERLEKQIKQFTRAVKDNQKALERYQREREEIRAKFDSDIARFNELRPPAAPAAAPPDKKPAG
jgi:predicted  nucleic acid-binding Zn-ribbon protein